MKKTALLEESNDKSKNSKSDASFILTKDNELKTC